MCAIEQTPSATVVTLQLQLPVGAAGGSAAPIKVAFQSKGFLLMGRLHIRAETPDSI